MTNIYQFETKSIQGQESSLDQYQGKVLLVVNTASRCGFTPQFKGLEELYQSHKDEGLVILGFPCNQFGSQDPGSDGEIEEFCQLNYGVSFPMHSKVEVNGRRTDPLFDYLKNTAPGVLGSKKIKWNFTKFLVNKDGKVLKRYSPMTKPEQLEKDIKKALAG